MWTTLRLAHSPTGEQNQKKRTVDVLSKPDNLIRYRHGRPRDAAWITPAAPSMESSTLCGDPAPAPTPATPPDAM
jgi:hypothetical protein